MSVPQACKGGPLECAPTRARNMARARNIIEGIVDMIDLGDTNHRHDYKTVSVHFVQNKIVIIGIYSG